MKELSHSQNPAATLELEDIHLPAQPGLWPPAIGWWLLLLLVIAALGFATHRFRRYRQRRKHLRKIQRALTSLEPLPGKRANPQTLTEVNQLLRTLALMYFPDQDIASLTGQAWLEFLDHSGKTRAFTEGAGKLLATGPYVATLPPSHDLHELIIVVKKWVKQVTRKKDPPHPLYPSDADQHPSGKRRGNA